MKNFPIILILVGSLLFSSCSDDDSGSTPNNLDDIVTIAIANGYNSLAAALTRADLVTTLQGDGPFTVFAPTDAQFTALLAEIGQTSVDDVPVDVLTQILLSHVVDGAILSSDLQNGSVTTLGGTTVDISVDGGITVSGLAVAEPFDVEGSNGVIHTLNGVLIPSDIAQFVNTVLEPAYFNDDFTTLVSAVVKAGLVDDILDAGEITIFAPTNDAFTAAGIDVANTDVETLTDVLGYHVVGAKVLSDAIPASATTLAELDIFFSLVDAGNFINGNAEIVDVDIEPGVGVVHVLDAVLLPPVGTVVDVAVAISEDSGEFSSLVAALTRTASEMESDTDLVAVLSGDGPFTVFAPTNDAFQELLDSNDDWDVLGDIDIDLLIDVLSYHVVSAAAFDKDLAGAVDMNNQIVTVLGDDLTFDLMNLTINTSANITGVNTVASNGVIHVIDEVLLPAQ